MHSKSLASWNWLLIDVWRIDAENMAVSQNQKHLPTNSYNLFIMHVIINPKCGEWEHFFSYFYSIHLSIAFLFIWTQNFRGLSSAFGQSCENNGCNAFKAIGHHLSLRWNRFACSNDCCAAGCYCWPHRRWFKGISLQSWLVGPHIHNE